MLKLTGIDIRKALLAADLNPNHYDEGALYSHLAALAVKPVTPNAIIQAAPRFKIRKV